MYPENAPSPQDIAREEFYARPSVAEDGMTCLYCGQYVFDCECEEFNR